MAKKKPYLCGQQADNFQFFRIPKLLITDKEYKEMSLQAKVLFGLMLDRANLSFRNGWIDNNNRVYIIYSNQAMCEDMGYSHSSISGYVKELENAGLITVTKRGLGQPNLIYLHDFTYGTKKRKSIKSDMVDTDGSIIL